MRRLLLGLLVLVLPASASANPPVASYLFPAGGQRGTTVHLKVGGLFLNSRCGFALDGPGVVASKEITSVPTLWFEGPQLPLPDSQRAEDYPRDMAGTVAVAADAAVGPRAGHVWTAEGVASGLTFVVGDLPEVVEQEVAGDALPVAATLPVTINGRVFPRRDVDLWTVELKKGETLTAAVLAQRLGSPLDARLEVLGPDGRVLADNDDADGRDPRVRPTAPADGTYTVRITDSRLGGSQAHVYRLTLTTGPWVDAPFPLGGRAGEVVQVTASGHGLPAAPVAVRLPAGDGPVWLPLVVGGKPTNPVLFDRDDLAGATPTDKALSPPIALDGRIDRPGEPQVWKLQLSKGRAVAVELRAARLGSRLLGALALKDAAGKVVAQEAGGKSEPTLAFTPPADGVYTLEVADRFKTRGGPGFGYRVRVTHLVADLRLKPAAATVNVPRGTTVKLRVQVDRLGGFADPVALAVVGLPAGVTAAPATIARGANAVEVAFTATAEALPGTAPVRLVAAGPAGPRTATVLVAPALPVPFKVVADYEMRWSARGSTHKRPYRIERNGYAGLLAVRLADRQARHLQGVVGPVLTLPPGQDAFEYPVQLAPDMEIGRTCRVCVMATGVVKAGGRDWEVSYSRAEQNDQIVTVVETGRLGVELGRPAVEARPGATVEVPFTVTRGRELAGPVTVELRPPAHMRGVSAPAVTLPADSDRGTLKVTFADGAAGPFNLPIPVRAAHAGRDGTTLAEAALEVVPEPRR